MTGPLSSGCFTLSLSHRDGSKLNCCLGLWRPSCCVTLCLFVSFAPSILKTFCFYASGGGELSRFSQMLSYSHLSCEERAILGFSIYIRLKIADFCVVRRNAVNVSLKCIVLLEGSSQHFEVSESHSFSMSWSFLGNTSERDVNMM